MRITSVNTWKMETNIPIFDWFTPEERYQLNRCRQLIDKSILSGLTEHEFIEYKKFIECR